MFGRTNIPKSIPPCGHLDRETQLTEIDFANTAGNIVTLRICSVPTCRDYCRAFVDLTDRDEEVGAAVEPDASGG